ncbi:hypothetical protein [Flavobacterium ginsengisoli]|uniref:hypothetical protein n=1 Tax=Flavobacterium ginsengisoli TaxID=871694 RepID=UPI0024158AE7|nr:hypothetical protein [Flavobacterium ginsengisoli]
MLATTEFSYTDSNGDTQIVNMGDIVRANETLTSLIFDNLSKKLTYTDESKVSNQVDLSGLVTGAETKINEGTYVSITGTGTTDSPYVINAISTADNLGNHTATQDLNMSTKNIVSANNITAGGKTATQTASIATGTDGSVPAAGSIVCLFGCKREYCLEKPIFNSCCKSGAIRLEHIHNNRSCLY